MARIKRLRREKIIELQVLARGPNYNDRRLGPRAQEWVSRVRASQAYALRWLNTAQDGELQQPQELEESEDTNDEAPRRGSKNFTVTNKSSSNRNNSTGGCFNRRMS